jgi:hypothetical protein
MALTFCHLKTFQSVDLALRLKTRLFCRSTNYQMIVLLSTVRGCDGRSTTEQLPVLKSAVIESATYVNVKDLQPSFLFFTLCVTCAFGVPIEDSGLMQDRRSDTKRVRKGLGDTSGEMEEAETANHRSTGYDSSLPVRTFPDSLS